MVVTMVDNSSQGLKVGTPTSWNTEHLVCLRLAPNPVDDAGLLSFATFSWLTPLMVRGYRHTLTVDTLPPLSPYDSSDTNAKRYQDSLESDLGGHLGGDLQPLSCAPILPCENRCPWVLGPSRWLISER